MNMYLAVILTVIVLHYLLELIADWLNVKNISDVLPDEFVDVYAADKYKESQNYLKDKTSFGIVSETFSLALTIPFILIGGFNYVDTLARAPGYGGILTGLLFAGIFLLVGKIIGIPFSLYDTYVIEEKYGFNKTKPRTFVMDIVKALLLTALIGGPIFAGILFLFDSFGSMAWLYCWLGLTAVQLFLMFISPLVIMPLFNKYVPLEEGELRTAIEKYAKAQDFKMKGVFKMDGSRRSSKSNAFFTGFGKSRRIVLFDTLIERHTVPELVAVIAHEMGHYKKGHIISGMIRSVLHTGLMLGLLSLFINNPGLFEAFKMEELSIYASLIFFGFLYTPIGMLIGIAETALSRKHEYEADAFAVETCGSADDLIAGLKRLSVDNLSNLIPHPLTVFLSYSHPPILKRIAALKAIVSR
jgi:STE24 endopeptidase